jgi:pheophorbide a oxygenase
VGASAAAAASVESAAADSEASASSSAAAEPPAFSWTAQWWPLLPVSYLDPRRPLPITLLGVDYVLWHDAGRAAAKGEEGGAGEWRLFRDRCPHRLAPLSEGRIDPAR